jgi:hypothetical protein
MAMREDVPALEAMKPNGKPHPVDRVLRDGEEVSLGGTVLVAHLTPGHTRGCTTWTMKANEGGKTFNVGDRIVMGGVRGDVVALGFFQTTIMEMGQPPPVQNADPAVWVQSRQFTGRVVTVSNARIFDEAVFNYTRDFPFIWEEMHLPIAYRDDRHKAEQLLLEAARKHAVDPDRLYAQNHHGVYRSDDGGASWRSIADGLPSDFGFPSVAHPHRPGVVYSFPLTADSERFPVDRR